MNIEILYISASITALLITSMIFTAFWLGLRGRKFVVYFELTDRLTDAIDLGVYVNGEFDYLVYKEYAQVCD